MRLSTGTAFGDGYEDGLRDSDDLAQLYLAGRDREKYLAGVECGAQDRNDGALDPVATGW